MLRPTRIALRFVVLLAVLAGIGLVLGPADDTRSPYLSALTNLAGSALAQPACDNATCQIVFPTGELFCDNDTPGFNCRAWGGGNHCEDSPC
jgi:hypothetical protein